LFDCCFEEGNKRTSNASKIKRLMSTGPRRSARIASKLTVEAAESALPNEETSEVQKKDKEKEKAKTK